MLERTIIGDLEQIKGFLALILATLENNEKSKEEWKQKLVDTIPEIADKTGSEVKT